MKKITLLILVLNSIQITAQPKLMSQNGIINFEASVPYFEEIKAVNEKSNCVLIPKTGEITYWSAIKNFRFEKKLMEEHFNDNYMESHRYPKAIFKGIIENFDLNNNGSIPQKYEIIGKLTLHGVTRKIIVYGTIKKLKSGYELTIDFKLNSDDYNINVPSVLRNKIAKNVTTSIYCVLH